VGTEDGHSKEEAKKLRRFLQPLNPIRLVRSEGYVEGGNEQRKGEKMEPANGKRGVACECAIVIGRKPILITHARSSGWTEG